ncbi:hypothetical protein MKEN_00858900 [Mycena kentingensis (nom. inval.)]|nr:hypothetical protein MKEN_00858900 [Mycena kentingensis (nom. inval.)]
MSSTIDVLRPSPYSTFLTFGLNHAAASDCYNYSHPVDDENEPQSPILLEAVPYHKNLIPRSPVPRKRRSSLSNAWHIANVAAQSPGRSRGNSFSVASEESSMLGRIRSGSLTNRLRSRKPLTSKRPVALLFAQQPPPTAPLPALPLDAPARPPLTRLTIHPQPVVDVFSSAPVRAIPVSPVPSSASAELYHGPGVWRGFAAIHEDSEMRA